MSRIIVLDPGHGGKDPGACGNGLQEAVITLAVCKLMKTELERHGFTVIMTREDDRYLTLSERAEIANRAGAHLFISDHCNSAAGNTATGVETFVHPNEVSGANLSVNISNRLSSVLGLRNRGAKEANFAVLRQTKMSAILIENAFISTPADAAILRDRQKDIANAITTEVLAFYGISCDGSHGTAPNNTSTQGSTFYRVVVGSYLDKVKASEVEAKLDNSGYNAFLDAFQKDGRTYYYRVIAGSYSVKANAEKIKSELEGKGYTGVFIAAYTKGETTTSTPSTPAPTPVVSKKYLNLPASASSWNVYPLGKTPTKGNECGKLNPAKFGGLSYEIVNTPQANVYTIQTSNFGKVNIYAASSTGATITTSPKY